MFILTDKTIGKSLANINYVLITYYNEKTDILDIFDNNFPIDENIIPIITSILEQAPKIYNYKQYNCIDTNTIIKKKKQVQAPYPSFYIDIDILEKDKFDVSRIELITTLIDNEDKQLIRMFSRKENTTLINTTDDFIQNILNETEYKIICWEYDWGSINISINMTTKMCNYEIKINIIEDKKIINSRLNSINNTLWKFNNVFNNVFHNQ